MAYRAAVVGGSGYTGAELLRLLAGHPEIEVAPGHRRLQRGRRGGRPLPVARRRLRGPDLRGGEPDRARRPRPRVPVPAARPVPGASPATWSTPSATWSTSAPTSGSRSPTTSSGTANAHTAPELIERFAFGMPELYRDEIVGAAARRVARAATRRPRRSRWRRCWPPAWWSRPGIVVDAVSGVSGAGRGLKATSLFAEVSDNVNAYGLLTHRHTAEMELALGHVAGQPVQVLFTPHLVPMTRGILATCYARPVPGDAPQHRRPARRLPRLLRRRAVRRTSPTGRRRPRPRSGRTPRTSPCATTSAPAPCSPSARSTTW